MRNMIDFASINQAALPHLPDLLTDLLPKGTIRGQEYLCGDLGGNSGKSLSINIESGKWSDFATGEKGSDPVSLFAAVRGITQSEAARSLAARLGINSGTIIRPARKKSSENWRPILPVPDKAKPAPKAHYKLGKPTEAWAYRDQKGRLLGYACRFDPPSENKQVWPLTFCRNDNGKVEWRWKHFLVPRPLYGLERLAGSPEASVLIVEGEKAADAATRLLGDRFVCLTWPAGCKAVDKVDFSPLGGRVCVIWPDNDVPGKDAALQIAEQLKKYDVKSIHAINPPDGKKSGWDLADAEVEGWTTDQVLSCIQNNCQEPEPLKSEKDSSDLIVVSIADLLKMEFPPRENLLSPWLPSQGICMVHAKRGIGKTFFSLGVACAVASGGNFLRWHAPSPVGVLFLDGEMPGVALQDRIASYVAGMDENIPDLLNIITPDLQKDSMPNLAISEGQNAVSNYITDETSLIVIDNISTLVKSGRENEAEAWIPIQEWVLKLRSQGKTVLFIHHSGKDGRQRGTSKREDILDTVISLRTPSGYVPEDGACFEIHFEKNRGIHGDDVKPFEAKLNTDEKGAVMWTIKDIDESTYDKVVALAREGFEQKEIAEELNIHKSSVSRHLKKAKLNGEIS